MEPEAVMNDEHLGASVSDRRRSTSFSDDYSVQRTNDDATQCKFAAVQLKYWDDEYLPRFAARTEAGLRRDPEISIGYWTRIAAVRMFVDNFIKKTDGECQIISLGCGFDTLFWRLKGAGSQVEKFVEVDFSSVTAKKIRLIRKPGTPNLLALCSQQPRETQHSDLHCGDYHLLGADVRQWAEFDEKLRSAGVDRSLPTLFLAECVLVYMAADQSAELIKNIANSFDTAVFLNYEQYRIEDSFGKAMEKNLEQRGLHLPGLSACKDEDAEIQRFKSNGWSHVTVMDMNTVFKEVLPQAEVESYEYLKMTGHLTIQGMVLAQWKLDYSSAGRHAQTQDASFNPPGFSQNAASLHHHVDGETVAEQQEHLLRKRAWDVALAPAKSLPMNMFMMYMAGRSVSIFPIMMVAMLLWRPMKALFSVAETFKPLEDENTGSMLLHKALFVLGNMGAIVLAVYKVHTMGLLPNTASDWLEFIPSPRVVQYSSVFNHFV